jgi:hypothetical protein
MKHTLHVFVFLLLSSVALTGCEAIGDIFQAGVSDGSTPGYSSNRTYHMASYQKQGLRKRFNPGFRPGSELGEPRSDHFGR